MTPEIWDALAEAAKWSRDNTDVLVDTHWIGGDAAKGEPYGYASWSARKGILCVRNPSRGPKNLTLKLAEAFELPRGAPQQYAINSPWKADGGQIGDAAADQLGSSQHSGRQCAMTRDHYPKRPHSMPPPGVSARDQDDLVCRLRPGTGASSCGAAARTICKDSHDTVCSDRIGAILVARGWDCQAEGDQ